MNIKEEILGMEDSEYVCFTSKEGEDVWKNASPQVRKAATCIIKRQIKEIKNKIGNSQ